MKKGMKKLLLLGLAGSLSVSSAMVALADWEMDEYGSDVYRKDDGNLAYNEWLQVGDKWYYFDGEYMALSAVTNDGYTLAEDGSWEQSIPQKSHEQIRIMYLASVEENTRTEYELWLNGSNLYASEEEFLAFCRSYANICIEDYPTLSPDEVITSQEFDQMIQKIIAEDANEKGKNIIKCILLSGNRNISDLDYLINLDLADASAEYKEQAKAEIRAEYERIFGSN